MTDTSRRPGDPRPAALLLVLLLVSAGAALLGSAAPALAASGDVAWHRAYDGGVAGSDSAGNLALSPDGRALYAAGWAQRVASPTSDISDVLLIKYAYSGARKWVRFYDGPGHGNDRAEDVVCDRWDNVVVGGIAAMADGYTDLVLVKYDAEGHRKWLRTYSAGPSSSEIAYALAVDGDGNVYAAGVASSAATGDDALLVKYDRYGRRRWARLYDSGFGVTDRGNSVVVDRRRGAVYLGGVSTDATNGQDWLLIKYSTAGTEAWVRTCGVAGARDDSAALALGSDGGVYQAGVFALPDPAGAATLVKWARDGTQPWTAQATNYGGADYFRDVAVDRYGLVHAVGPVMNSSGNYDGFVLTRTASGVAQPDTSIDSAAQNDYFWAVACDGAGNVYATGESNDTVSFGISFLTAKFPRSTGRVWTATASEAPINGFDVARDVVVRTGTRAGVYVSGQGQSPVNSYDAFTVKYRP